MATWFSDHYTEDGINQSSLPVLGGTATPSARKKHSRIRGNQAQITVLDAAITDVFRLMTMRSSDILIDMHWLTDGGFVAETTSDLGCYKSGDAHDGAVLDADLFDSVIDISTAETDRVEALTQGVLTGQDRGLALWQLVAAGADPDTWIVDPKIDIDITLLMIGEPTSGLGTFRLWVTYMAGD